MKCILTFVLALAMALSLAACHNYRFQMHHAPDAILRTEAKFIILLLL